MIKCSDIVECYFAIRNALLPDQPIGLDGIALELTRIAVDRAGKQVDGGEPWPIRGTIPCEPDGSEYEIRGHVVPKEEE